MKKINIGELISNTAVMLVLFYAGGVLIWKHHTNTILSILGVILLSAAVYIFIYIGGRLLK